MRKWWILVPLPPLPHYRQIVFVLLVTILPCLSRLTASASASASRLCTCSLLRSFAVLLVHSLADAKACVYELKAEILKHSSDSAPVFDIFVDAQLDGNATAVPIETVFQREQVERSSDYRCVLARTCTPLSYFYL